MERLGDCLELMHSTWLAGPISYCFPQRLQDQSSTRGSKTPAAPGTKASKTSQVCCEQPRSCTPPVYRSTIQQSHLRADSQSTLPRPLTAHRIPSWDTSSRPLSALSFRSRKSAARRPTIGAPSDFRKVQSGRIAPIRKTPTFRPLQLSIYLPGNELPDLPLFWEEGETDAEGVSYGLERPAPALAKSKSDPMLLRRPSSTFSIPRKPVASRSSSITMDAMRFSVESSFTSNTLSAINDFPKPPKARSSDQLRSIVPDRRSSIATTRSTQAFLDSLDSRLPQPPPPTLRSNSEPGCVIYKRASEQSLRLRTHLEERQSLEKRLPDLMEEVSPLSPEKKLSPILDNDSIFESDHTAEKSPIASHTWFQYPIHGQETSTHRPKSSSGSSTLLNPPTVFFDPSTTDTPITTTIRPNTPNSLRNRFSQWLLKALPALPPIDTDPRSSTPRSSYSIAAPTAHTKQSSTSTTTYWDFGARGSMDIEKAMVPMASPVGVAF